MGTFCNHCRLFQIKAEQSNEMGLQAEGTAAAQKGDFLDSLKGC